VVDGADAVALVPGIRNDTINPSTFPEAGMNSQIDNLVAMRDIETLYELMTEDEDWMRQLDAAEGLIKLGDRRGFEFIMTATLSDDEEILEMAQEILDTPEAARMRREVDAELAAERRVQRETAKKRLASGGKVYRYKMIHLTADVLMGDDPLGKGFEIPALDNRGLEGWEVVNMLPTRRALLVGSVDDHFTGAYFLLKKEMLPNESADLDRE
jgi:hypothetical protein